MSDDLVEAGARLVETGTPLLLLQHGRKAPIEGPDGSWLIVDDPDAVASAIEQAAHDRPVNIGALLAPKFDSHLLVVDTDGADAWPKLTGCGKRGVQRGGAPLPGV